MFDSFRRTVRPLTNVARSLIDSFYALALYRMAGRKAEGILGVRGAAGPGASETNPLEAYFDSRRDGAGIWKWRHYFDAYHAHFSRFRGKRPRILEIGVYSGGSLEMWREYFGEGCELFGVDIDPKCRRLERPGITIKTADQSDRSFWRKFREEVGQIDIVIDDGGHRPRQQRPTFEEILRCIKPGGVYLCEDLHGSKNPFVAYLQGFTNALNADRFNAAQAWVKTVAFYPYIVIVELLERPRGKLAAEKRGGEWL